MRCRQFGISRNLSPITPPEFPPFSEIPEFTMWPSLAPTKGLQLVVQALLGFSGSRFGTIQGFTQRGCTGMMVPVVCLPTFPESEGLKTSAVAVALTVFVVLLQMREKKVGKPVCWIWTVTIGLTAKAVDRVEQSVLELMVPPLPAKYVTVEVPATAAPPT